MGSAGRVPAYLTVAEEAGVRFAEGPPDSGEAGPILQKLRNYKIRVAIVYAPDRVRFSSRFGEMAAEESRGGQFGLFESVLAARKWLSSPRK